MEMEVKKKELKFKGKTLEELKTLDVREFAKLLRSRQRRTVLRNFQEHENFVKRANNQLAKGKRAVRTHNRTLIIVPGLIGIKLQIYNGKDFVPVEITMEMLGHKFGEFAPTRVRARHNKDEKVKKK
ncbi:30S ribosomal protein S19 [archaeon]|nr:30S ribosomal protein S19 [archaeon]